MVGSKCYLSGKRWEEVGRTRLGQPWEGRLEGSEGHMGAPGDPREGRERNSPVGSPGGSRAGRNHGGHSYPTLVPSLS